jgi:Fe-S-cluster-containing dehydrogenase component
VHHRLQVREQSSPIGVTRTYVKHVDVGVFPQTRRAHQVTRCNQCAHAPCVAACPTAAMFKRADGIVDFDKSICIGCKACMAACPYDADLYQSGRSLSREM